MRGQSVKRWRMSPYDRLFEHPNSVVLVGRGSARSTPKRQDLAMAFNSGVCVYVLSVLVPNNMSNINDYACCIYICVCNMRNIHRHAEFVAN